MDVHRSARVFLRRWRLPFAVGVLALLATAAAGQERRQVGVTRGSQLKPDYERIFSMSRVHEIRIRIPSEQFDQMQQELSRLGRGRGFGPGRFAGPPPFGLADAAALQESVMACAGKATGGDCSMQGAAGRCAPGPDDGLMCRAAPGPFRGGPLRGGAAFRIPEPTAVRVSVRSQGRAWTNVRMRYKGNSSLMAATATGNGKVPFRLEFDADDAPGGADGFFGFHELTFSSNFSDDSQIREVLATEVLRDRRVPAARAAFYRVFVDSGAGDAYWGLYTMVEDPSDGPMLDAQLSGRGGNLYKPEGPAANWTRFDAASFEKKTNRGNPDVSDIVAAIEALHADATDHAGWRARLERAFDVEGFLRWLAVNTAIDNWDTYGAMAHNYYLYGDRTRGGRLRWIPWDHNMAFGAGPGPGRGFPGREGGMRGLRGGFPPPEGLPGDARFGGGPFPGGPGGLGGPPGPRRSQDVLHRDVGTEWPLISRLLADPVYAARYRASLNDALGGLMAHDAMARRVRTLHALIEPAVVGQNGENKTHTTVSSAEAFRDSADALLRSISQRRERIQTALSGPAR